MDPGDHQDREVRTTTDSVDHTDVYDAQLHDDPSSLDPGPEPSGDDAMNAIAQKCRPKHQVLVLKCYPRTTKGDVDVKPNSSELSYLLFYATSRRSKIQKIGSFLEKKTASDVWRLRIGSLRPSSKSRLKTSPCSPAMFSRFSTSSWGPRTSPWPSRPSPPLRPSARNHDVSSSFADQGYLAQYESVVRSYATLASTRQTPGKGTPSQAVVMKWRTVGLEAIRSVCSSDPLSSVAGRQLAVIVPIILENLWHNDDTFLDVLLSRVQSEEKSDADKPMRRRTSVTTVKTSDTAGDTNPIALVGTALDVDKLAEEDIGVLALQCLKQIYVVPNQPQIHSATSSLLKFVLDRVAQNETVIDAGEKPGSERGWAIQILATVARWAPVQDRYIILVTTMDHISRLPLTEENLQQHIVLAIMVSSLLQSDINLIGLSVMDVLIGFIRHMKRLMHLPGPSGLPRTDSEREEQPQAGGDTTEQRMQLLDRIQQCIGGLATHVYYADQISDMISAILLRLRPSRSTSTNSSPPGEKADLTVNEDAASSHTQLESFLSLGVGKTAALKAIKSILLVANPQTKITGNFNLSRTRVPIHVWEGTQWLLRDLDGLVRKAYVDVLVTWLERETTLSDLKARDENLRPHHRSAVRSGRELQPGGTAQRASSTASHREKPLKHHRSHFLQLLHLAIYDNALQFIDLESDIVLLHILLTKLVFKLGVNAVRYGLSMVFRLQEDILDIETPLQKVRIGSLCHGYFWAVTEKFDIETSSAGRAIQDEIIRRRSKNFWVGNINVPTPPVDVVGTPGVARAQPALSVQELEKEELIPFDDRSPLVSSIAEGYADSMVSPPSSPAASPGRSFSHPILGSALSHVPAEPDNELPLTFKELMLTDWTRETAQVAIQAASKSESLTGSRTGTTATGRHRRAMNGLGNGQGSPLGSHHNLRNSSPHVAGAAGLAPLSKMRKSSVRSGVSATPSANNRAPVASVDQLKMVMSGQLPPTAVSTSAGLRNRDDDDDGSSGSGSDSMVSYDYSPSELSFNPATQQSDNSDAAQRPGSNGRRSGVRNSLLAHTSSSLPNSEMDGADEVPPVPPLPDLRGLSSKIGDLHFDLPAGGTVHDQVTKPAKRNISTRSSDSRYQSTLRGEEPPMDLRDLLQGIDSRAGEHSLGNVTRPPY
ncbi:efr-3 [Verticillium dahliae VdLs.17]|uniref:Efr-3 n=1 Tax=Verticillium dahliae (strain VdLs.17 / ATCC MYA-4575 / FGSC 10137) TaxID=498257 RepID=G2WW12_VERDV|nr:efr-3 [Verticillium dahliae VdLs.17]EGY19782.1 efr-3 [Verticillium dahliae VdLs.17]